MLTDLEIFGISNQQSDNKIKLHKNDKLNTYKETNCKKNNNTMNRVANCINYKPSYINDDFNLIDDEFGNENGINGKIIGDNLQVNNDISIKQCAKMASDLGSNYSFSFRKYRGSDNRYRSNKNNECIIGPNSSIIQDDNDYDTYSKSVSGIRTATTVARTTVPAANPTQINIQDNVLNRDANEELCNSNENYFYKGQNGCLPRCVLDEANSTCASSSNLRTIGSINNFDITAEEISIEGNTIIVNVSLDGNNGNFWPTIIKPTGGIQAKFFDTNNGRQTEYTDLDYTLDYRAGNYHNVAVVNTNNNNRLLITIPDNMRDFDVLKLRFTDIYNYTSDEITVRLLQRSDADGNIIIQRASQNNNNNIRSIISSNRDSINNLAGGGG